MAWTEPTVADFKARYSVFSATPDEQIQPVLNEAIPQVGPSWLERDRSPGVLALTAHLLVTSGVTGVSGASGSGVSSATGALKRVKVGDEEHEYATPTTGVAQGKTDRLAMYRTTLYGQYYLSLMSRNFPGVAVV
jgi:hypothetical protein